MSDVDLTEREADQSAARGDIAAARQLLEQVVAAAPGRIDSWLKLAALRRAGGDIRGALDAVSDALRVDPLHFMALMSRARLLEGKGDADEAARFYLRALAQLSDDEPVAQSLRGLIDHARQVGEAYRTRVSGEWMNVVDRDGGVPNSVRLRLARFTSNALRQTRVYHSEPTHYHYPGLIEREFHDRADFPWLATLEAATDDIRDEFLALQHETSARSEPYVQYAADLPVRQWAALNNSLDWTAFHLLQGGREVTANAARCPKTMAILREIEQPHVGGRSPNAMFSLLKPHTRIPPHVGIANTRLVCHLPLVVPDHCWFRVGATRREWRPGEAFVFDDTIEHEAANDGDVPRVVFIIDTWHPGLDATERAAVKRLMEADESADGAPL
ncbi:aspartyl/asparaginyl beta-hydroxylase domain-containing protein [Sphingomonas sp. SUN019]|uniref:aspartyl/asparaginyl beta-hydroxylase domain-containing protein n=1 Tax=Sphingomonas sp. SUN019 TaxID=2937788 RepID=UPI0021645941|nr:aspartyl/asparaginyl beta-hydroxylase domain-containing protein [Sphingomonas sp. SUN019]UVO50446.1 aspartyl/asparaginyl beta-hydroxylase domain-containing protein [Sphingomonas sp. SUN019]